jgi:hypothetical protein
MIGVQLLGGLGNQMFQAAAGYALARRHDAALAFDLSRFRERGLRAYALEPFGLVADVRTGEGGALRRVGQILGLTPKNVPGWWNGAVYREPGFAFDPAFEHLGDDTLLTGYFQAPRYFEPVAAEIAAFFAPEKLASPEASDLAAAISGDEAVAIHVRRGDYAVDSRALAVHGTLPEGYYQAAADHIRAKIPNARFFVFSDDPAGAETLAARLPNTRPMRGKAAGDDLFLMSCARHHIIANSSFSWWSAWLDRRPGGIRIAPKAWFTPEAERSRPTDDLIPADWVRL